MPVGDVVHVVGSPYRVVREFFVRHAMTETDEQRKQRIKNGQPEPTYGYTVQSVEKISQRKTHT